jgi:hypothetical protein
MYVKALPLALLVILGDGLAAYGHADSNTAAR